MDVARHRTAEGLGAYAERDANRLEHDISAAREAVAGDVIADMDARPNGSRPVLAHAAPTWRR